MRFVKAVRAPARSRLWRAATLAALAIPGQTEPGGQDFRSISNGAQAGCTPAPAGAVADYGARGPFATRVVERTGPDGSYTLFLPAQVGEGGFRHPVATWGNGITTVPNNYTELLSTFASHGFVVIASNSPRVTARLMRAGLDWLIAQDRVEGEFLGHLVTACAASIGYSLGGGAAVTTGSHPSVVATVSFHGLEAGAEDLHAPLLLITSTSDGFVTKSGYVQPTYDRSTGVPTLMATLDVPGVEPGMAGHLIPMQDGAGPERAPAVAWLRFWVYGDPGAREFFYGPECTLCQVPWTDIQRKNAEWD